MYQFTAGTPPPTGPWWTSLWARSPQPRSPGAVVRHWRRWGCEASAVLTEQRPRVRPRCLHCRSGRQADQPPAHPPSAPNHNAVRERIHGTILQECWHTALNRRRLTSIRQLQAEAEAWLIRYSTSRRNHGADMRSSTPAELLTSTPSDVRPDIIRSVSGATTCHLDPASTPGPEALA